MSNKCPEQPSGVKCCVGGGGTGGGVVGPCPEIVSRSSWGARSPKRPLSNMADSSVRRTLKESQSD